MKAQIWNLRRWISVTDSNELCEIFDKMTKDAGFKVLAEVSHYFEPQGFTKLYLLAESHFAMHTFPEEGKTYIELSSCNKQMQKEFERLLNSDGRLKAL